jgi:hypothetical protein
LIRPQCAVSPEPCTNAPTTGKSVMSEFDRFCQGHVMRDNEEGWAPELCCYLKELPTDVTKDTDIIEWWQVWLFFLYLLCTILNLPTSRIMLKFILHLPELCPTSSHVKHLQFLVSSFFLQVSRQLMIDRVRWVQSSLRSYR